MFYTFHDGSERELTIGTIVHVTRDACYSIGTSGFPYTENNRWIFVQDGEHSRHPICIAPTKETLADIGSRIGILHNNNFDNSRMVIEEASVGTLSWLDDRYYYVHPKDVVPTDDVIPFTLETAGKIPHTCFYCNATHDDCIEMDGRFICPECMDSHVFICTVCGKPHDTRRRMKGELGICRPCFDANADKYARAENDKVYLKEDLVPVVGAYDEISYVTPEYAERNTFICAECGSRHYFSGGVKVYGKHYCVSCADVKYPICNHCHRRHSANNTFMYDGRNVCRRCRDMYYSVCDICGHYHHNNSFYVTEDTHKRVCTLCTTNFTRCSICGRIRETPYETKHYSDTFGNTNIGPMCDTCLRNYEPCADCGVLVYKNRNSRRGNNARNSFPDGKTYCNSCAANHFFRCAACGNWITVGAENDYHGDGDNRICNNCYNIAEHGLRNMRDASNTGWAAPHGIKDYGYKPDGIVFPSKDDTGIYYGIELETDRWTDGAERSVVANKVNNILGFTYAKRDGSLGWDGIEFVSHPATIQYYLDNKNKFAEAMRYLRGQGYQSHSGGQCGLHVHVSAFPLLYDTENGVEKLIYIWDKFWDNIAKCSRRGQEGGGQWAARICRDTEADNTDLKISAESLKKTKNMSKNRGRYQAINLQNSHTIEFRLMRGTLNIDTFIGSIQLISSIVDIAVAKSLKEIREMSWDDILAFHDYAELKALWESHKDYSVVECGSLTCDNDNSYIGDTYRTDDTLAVAA